MVRSTKKNKMSIPLLHSLEFNKRAPVGPSRHKPSHDTEYDLRLGAPKESQSSTPYFFTFH